MSVEHSVPQRVTPLASRSSGGTGRRERGVARRQRGLRGSHLQRPGLEGGKAEGETEL